MKHFSDFGSTDWVMKCHAIEDAICVKRKIEQDIV